MTHLLYFNPPIHSSWDSHFLQFRDSFQTCFFPATLWCSQNISDTTPTSSRSLMPSTVPADSTSAICCQIICPSTKSSKHGPKFCACLLRFPHLMHLNFLTESMHFSDWCLLLFSSLLCHKTFPVGTISSVFHVSELSHENAPKTRQKQVVLASIA